MAGMLSLSSNVEVFPCPKCRETINTALSTCPFCQAPIDSSAASISAAATTRISQACSDASYLKIMAWALLAFLVISFIPFFGFVGAAGLWFLRIAIPVMVMRWWIRFGKIKTADPDFAQAERAAIIVGIVSLLALATGLAGLVLARHS